MPRCARGGGRVVRSVMQRLAARASKDIAHRARARTQPRGTCARYSTVTLLAKLRGWSTSVPLMTAT